MAETCFTCLRETADPIPIVDQAENAKLAVATPYRGVIVAKHFWFDLNDLIQGSLCPRCWSNIEEFHKFYCEIEEAHEQKMRLPFAEVKQELLDGEEEESLGNVGEVGGNEAEEQNESDPEDVTAFLQEEHLLDDDDEDDKEAPSQDDEDFEGDDGDAPDSAQKPKKRARKRLRHADKIAQGDELIASYCNMHCDECSQAFKSFNALQMHSASEHKKRAYVYCCDRRFNTRTRLYEHVLRHINPEQFQCDMCKRNCVDSEGLKRHKLKMHTPEEERTFKCDKCSKAFAQESVLTSHKRYHEAMENKEFPCGQCNKL